MYERIVGTLLRRAAAVDPAASWQDVDGKPIHVEIPAWGIALFVITAMFFMTLHGMVDYTFGHLIPALVMVESPQPAGKVFDDGSLDADSKQPEVTESATGDLEDGTRQPFITSCLRTILRHLVSQGGKLNLFRGLCMFAVYSLTQNWATSILAHIPFFPFFLAPIIASIACAQLAMTWTHIAITENSFLPFWKRIPSRQFYKKIIGPTAIFACVVELVIFIPLVLALGGPLKSIHSYAEFKALPKDQRHSIFAQLFAISFLFVALAITLIIPAKVALTRVQASLLHTESKTIVPIDRTFKGRVNPEAGEAVGMMDAWQTFDWSDRIRLAKVYVKVFAMEYALMSVFFFAMALEAYLILGDDLMKFFPDHSKDDSATTAASPELMI